MILEGLLERLNEIMYDSIVNKYLYPSPSEAAVPLPIPFSSSLLFLTFGLPFAAF